MIADLALDGLAAYRLTRLMRQDTITEPVRDAIEARSVEVEAIPVGRSSNFATPCRDCGHGLSEHIASPSLACVIPTCGCTEYHGEETSALRDVQPYAFLRDGLDCPWCASVWAAGIVLALHRIPGGRLLRDVLAVAAVAGVANYVDDHLTGVVHDVEHDDDIGTAQTGGDE